MVNALRVTAIKCLAGAAFVLVLGAQTDADRERRLADLESKMRRLDPSFLRKPAPPWIHGSPDLERRLDVFPAAHEPSPVFHRPKLIRLQPLSVTGDAQKSEEH